MLIIKAVKLLILKCLRTMKEVSEVRDKVRIKKPFKIKNGSEEKRVKILIITKFRKSE